MSGPFQGGSPSRPGAASQDRRWNDELAGTRPGENLDRLPRWCPRVSTKSPSNQPVGDLSRESARLPSPRRGLAPSCRRRSSERSTGTGAVHRAAPPGGRRLPGAKWRARSLPPREDILIPQGTALSKPAWTFAFSPASSRNGCTICSSDGRAVPITGDRRRRGILTAFAPKTWRQRPPVGTGRRRPGLAARRPCLMTSLRCIAAGR